MLQTILGDDKFCDMMNEHILDIFDYLLEKGVNFAILTNVSEVVFEPELPDEIKKSFKPITMFILAGYTFESVIANEDSISFEAGFGHENFGSLVTVPILSVLQVIVEDTPVFINLSIPSNKKESKKEEIGIKKSMEALLSNPENKKLFKK
jgi:hypothetical protein